MQESRRPAHRPLRLEQSPLERARLWVEILAFLAAGCWAIYTFVYQTKIAPSFLPPHEVVSVDVHRVAELPTDSAERVDLNIRNNGSIDVDTAALTINVSGAKSSDFANLTSTVGPSGAEYRGMPEKSWKALYSEGALMDGAISGRRRQHLILRPGDSVSLQFIALVPHGYRVLRVHFETIFARYPISPRMDLTLVHKNDEILLKGGGEISFDSYFGV